MVSAATRAGRDPSEVTLVAVTKTRTVEEILQVYEQGHRDFGENRAQELALKAPLLPSDIRWHFIGGLQTNKVRLVRDSTALLQSLDRMSLAKAWLKGKGLPPPALVQVNIGGEEQKHGVDPSETSSSAASFVEMGLAISGLMTIPPIPGTPEDSRPHFVATRELFEQLSQQHQDFTTLSMGMTDDYEVAVEEGSTMIRVGRAIFGPRS